MRILASRFQRFSKKIIRAFRTYFGNNMPPMQNRSLYNGGGYSFELREQLAADFEQPAAISKEDRREG